MKQLQDNLIQIGFTRAQAEIYTTLLKLKKATVKEIAEDSGAHRTHIYDTIDELKEKGIVTYYKQGKNTYFTAVDPKHLFSFIDEKKTILEQTLPDLQQLFQHSTDKTDVQVYKGSQGIKSAFNSLLKKEKATLYGLNIQGQLREQLPVFAKQFYRKLDEKKIEYKGIYTKDYGIQKSKHKIRYIHPNNATPAATHICEDIVLIELWGPDMIAVEIRSKQIAESYKKHFDIIWQNASRKPILEK